VEETGGKIFRSNGKHPEDVRIALIADPLDTEVDSRNKRWTFSAENVSGVRNRRLLDTFVRIKLDSEAKAVSPLAFHTRKQAWLRFHPIPGIGLAIRCLVFWRGSDPVGEISFLESEPAESKFTLEGWSVSE
jgi:hypothetical protein